MSCRNVSLVGRFLGPVLACVLASAGLVASAQDSVPPTGDPQPSASTAAGDTQPPPRAAYVAMTTQERWNGYLRENFTSPSALLLPFGMALVSHIRSDPREWGEGAQGYGRRLGSHLARFTIKGTIKSGLAAALQYDTRYHRHEGQKGWQRAGYALRRTFFTCDRSGRTVLDIPGLASIYGAPMLATYWHPQRYGPLAQGLHGGNFGIPAQIATNFAKEFGPDLRHFLQHK
jgi:hypothetical protein